MSFEDIVAIQAACVKKQTTKDKKKRGRKRKNAKPEIDEQETEAKPEVTPASNKHGQKRKRAIPELEADEPETEAEPEVTPALKRRGRKRHLRSMPEPDEPEPGSDVEVMLPVPWRAPVAQMV